MSLRSSHPKGSMPNAVKSEVGPGEATGVSIPQGSPAVSLYCHGIIRGSLLAGSGRAAAHRCLGPSGRGADASADEAPKQI